MLGEDPTALAKRQDFNYQVLTFTTFWLTRLMPTLAKQGIVNPQALKVMHDTLQILENEDFLPVDKEKILLWRTTLARDAGLEQA
ncbi:hypothetical protein SPZE110945_12890 [Sphingomonas zeae]